MEDGEIHEDFEPKIYLHSNEVQSAYGPFIDTSGATYLPSLEWPGDAESTSAHFPSSEASHTPQWKSDSPCPSSPLRLLVQRSAILRKRQKLALLDGYSEIHIGRDLAPASSDTPRIRLKEMEVSKLHATIYWDQERLQWAIVDMGSKHGTFIQSMAAHTPSGSAPEDASKNGVRLSAPRVASVPRVLHHLDGLSIGGTSFIIHIHEGEPPCAACSPQGSEEIPLFLHLGADRNAGTSTKRTLDLSSTETPLLRPPAHNPKKALASLKRSLLSTNSAGPAPPTTQLAATGYLDRSARRRALHPDHSPAATSISSAGERLPASAPAPATPPSITTTPPTPLSASNVGHRLLMKQGWLPGSALGGPLNENPGLVVPLDPPSTIGRAGIGASARAPSSVVAAQDGDWKDEGKRRRWAEFRENDGNP